MIGSSDPRRLAILGTRGIPARYGGFETLAERLASGLTARGHEVWVYARNTPGSAPNGSITEHEGARVRHLPAPRSKYLETVVHTGLSAADAMWRRFDAVLVCNSANAVWLPLLRSTGCRIVLNVDGLEWRRRKWGPLGKGWHRMSARLGGYCAHVLVTDARYLQQYWLRRFRRRSGFVPYGAPVPTRLGREVLEELGLEPGGYFLWVGRVEPENNPDVVAEAFGRIRTDRRLVLVGGSRYATDLWQALTEHALRDPRIVLAGPRYGHEYEDLQANALAYVQAGEVGGTHPALLEAMSYGGCVIVNDIPEHREVIGDHGRVYAFNSVNDLARLLQESLDGEAELDAARHEVKQYVRSRYSWDRVVRAYEHLLTAGAESLELDCYERASDTVTRATTPHGVRGSG